MGEDAGASWRASDAAPDGAAAARRAFRNGSGDPPPSCSIPSCRDCRPRSSCGVSVLPRDLPSVATRGLPDAVRGDANIAIRLRTGERSPGHPKGASSPSGAAITISDQILRRLSWLILPLTFLLALSGCDSEGPPPVATASAVGAQPAYPLSGQASGTRLFSSGLASDGQLGRTVVGDSAAEFAPVDLPAGQIRAVAAGGRHSLAVLADGTVESWGADDAGQLGQGKPAAPRREPGQVIAPDGGTGQLRGVVAAAADSDFSMALREDGTVVTWGAGDAGQRGNGAEEAPPYPTVVLDPRGRGPLRDVVQIAADGRTELALLRDGTVMAWGANLFGMLGDGTRKSRSLPAPVLAPDGRGPLRGVRQIAVGGQNGLAAMADGSVLSWGYNDLGQLGDGTTQARLLPVRVLGPDGTGALREVVQVSAAEKHAYALRRDSTAVAWGNNTAGQLGDGTLTIRSSPVPVVSSGGADVLRGITQMVAGEAYGVAVLNDGTVRTWGANRRGQLGSGDRVSRSRPGWVVGQGAAELWPVTGVGAGERHLLLVVR